jgi:hypothetical protein
MQKSSLLKKKLTKHIYKDYIENTNYILFGTKILIEKTSSKVNYVKETFNKYLINEVFIFNSFTKKNLKFPAVLKRFSVLSDFTTYVSNLDKTFLSSFFLLKLYFLIFKKSLKLYFDYFIHIKNCTFFFKFFMFKVISFFLFSKFSFGSKLSGVKTF